MLEPEKDPIELFHPDTMVDRGRMTMDQFWGLFQFNRLKQFEEYPSLRKNNPESYRDCKKKYKESGYDFTDSISLNFGWKREVWFSVKTTDILRVIQIISPKFMAEQRFWNEWRPSPSEDFHKQVKGNYVTVLQPCMGTIFIRIEVYQMMSQWGFAQNYQEILKELSKYATNFWTELASEFPEVSLCWKTSSNQTIGTIFWKNGKLRRVLATYDAGPVFTFGTPLDDEVLGDHPNPEGKNNKRYLNNEFFETTYNLGISPEHIPPLFPGEKAYCWNVGI